MCPSHRNSKHFSGEHIRSRHATANVRGSTRGKCAVRAHGPDGALAASRAAYIGGCVSTSNVLAGKVFGIPVAGTHAHSWVMSFETEHEAFEAYADAMPGNCVFLVDTYDSIEGIYHAVEVGRRLQSVGKSLTGIRLDSGDLNFLSIAARSILD